MTATNTRFDMKTPVLLSLISGLLLAAHPAAAAETVAVPKAGLGTCLQTVDRLNRLDCFDQLLGTPMSVLSGGVSPSDAPAPPSQEKRPSPLWRMRWNGHGRQAMTAGSFAIHGSAPTVC
nr:hypothetical protein [Marinicella sp. W31]MDC2875918.1 hypothetical protein [Marinicella sp. W31]